MMQRCTCPGTKHYDIYGGAGVTVCDRWKVFENFLVDMGPRPEGCTLDRFPNKIGNYEPDNCRWANSRVQGRNKSNNRMLEFRGVTKALVEWSEYFGVPEDTLWHRLNKGWDIEKALTQKVRKRRAIQESQT